MDCRKVIKVLGVLSIIGAIFCFLGGIGAIAGGGLMSAVGANEELMGQVASDPGVSQSMDELNSQLVANGGQATDTQTAVVGVGIGIIVLGVIFIITGILDILEGVFAFKAANGKGANPAFIFGVIALVLNVVTVIASVIQGGSIFSYLFSIIISALYVYCAKTIKDEEANA